MNLLLDTHSLIWFLNGDKKLSDKVKVPLKIPIIRKSSVLHLFGKLRLK